MDTSCDDNDAECAKSTCSHKEKFDDLLRKMNLTDKYPQKLSLRDAMTVRQETLGTIRTTDQLPVLPYLILQKIMMCDHRCRSCLFKPSSLAPQSKFIKLSSSTTQSKFIKLSPSATQSKFSGSDSDSESSNSDSDNESDDTRLHPVDCMLAVLHCCDDILRQDLISKLSLCQLAIPFLLPNPIDSSVTFLLWALRSIFRGWKCHNTGGKEHRIVDYQGPIVSFMRIGDAQSSKSEILNAVIGGESKFFFNQRECEGGDCERNFVDGLIEMCCYLPSGKDTDPFTDAVMFLNLRGDVLKHPKQVMFLQKVCFISVVLVAEANINEGTIKVLQSLAETPGGIILLLTDEKTTKKGSRSRNLDLLRQALPKSKTSKVKLKSKNTATLTAEIQQVLVEKLNSAKSEDFKSVADCHVFAREAGIAVDEDKKDSKIGKQYAETVMKKVHSVHFNEVKDTMLPLQGPSLWHQWAKHDKERYRHAERKAASIAEKEAGIMEKEATSFAEKQAISVTEYNDQKDKQKMEIRKYQLSKCTTLTPVMDGFMECLLETNVSIRKYFLQWLKLFLDDHSREILPKLHAKYQETRDQLNALKQKNQSGKDTQTKELTKKLKIQNQELINASFGLEHLFREMGQIYEARMDSIGHEVSQTLKDKANCLPQIMAEIMDEGHALELMDGDASHVPTLWVLAVIERLKAVCGKNAREKNGGKIFVLSILGIQSTGKSTLLNTMFGLRFNVSAGRCTRGAYIQLLPLNNSLRQKIDCDYVLIVDTEGLRAPELQLEGLKHDNELATFVIGLADATIINIFGETPGDLDDILQTSLHAFIRMRKIEMNPGCMFVHQNVPDVLANSKSKVGRQKFHDKLDNMTQAAAKVENCEGEFNLFDQVIDFNDSEDVFYFPSLWKGDPPMAPVNIGYSESAQTLKTAIVELTQRKQICRCSLEEFKLRVKKLWEAVLQENFVFSFKNTLEVCAYNEFDSQYAKWSWTLQSKMLEWESNTKWTIEGCDFKTEDEIRDKADNCLKKAEEEILSKSYNTISNEMQTFLDGSDHSETLSQFKHKIETRIKDLHHENKMQAKKLCNGLVAKRLHYAGVEKIEKCHMTEIQGYIRSFVDEAWKTGKQYTELEIKQMFETKWKGWMDSVAKTKEENKIKYPRDYEIEADIIEILRELMQSSDAKIIEKLSAQPLNSRSLSLSLEVDKKIHLSSTKWFGYKPLGNDDILTATKLTEEYFIKAREYFNTITAELIQFNSGHVYKLLKDLNSSVEDLMKPEKKSSFTFTPEYKVDMALVVCAYALDVFNQTTRKIEADNDPIAKLNGLKDTFLTNFEDEYNRVNNETKGANGLCNLLSSSLEEAIPTQLSRKIADAIRIPHSFFSSKANFKIQILTDLAENTRGFSRSDQFEHYKTYLVDTQSCFRDWIAYYLKPYCDSVIIEFASTILSDKIDAIEVALCEPTCNIHDIKSWLDNFVNKIEGTVPLKRSTMDAFVGECDVSKFSQYIMDRIKKVKVTLSKKCSDRSWLTRQVNGCSNSPDRILYGRLIGCTCKCPFCAEQCERTNPCQSGQNHYIKVHRYLSLGRWLYHGTNELVLRTCTDYAGTDESFRKTDGSLHKFRYSDEVYKNWKIDQNSTKPAYWQWFVYNFYSEVQKWVGTNYTQVYYISKDAAIKNLPDIIHCSRKN